MDSFLLLCRHLFTLALLAAAAWGAGLSCARSLSRDGGVFPAGGVIAVGLAMLAQGFLLLGLVGGLSWSPWVLGAVAAAGGVAAARPLRGRLGPRLGLGAALLGPGFLLTLYPPLGFDQTLYHLPFTQAFAAGGDVPFLPHLRFPVFPQLAELLGVPLYLLAGGTGTQLVGLLALGATLALVHHWARQLAPGASAGLAAAALIGSPAGWYLASCGYVEPVLALFVFAALWAAEQSRTTHSVRWAIAAGALAGSAAGVKYLGLYFLPAAALLLVRREPWQAATRRLAPFALGALVALAPSYGRLVFHTGNPLFPFFPEVFGPSPWAADEFLGTRGLTRLAEAATLWWDVTFNRVAAGSLPPYSPAFLLGAPLVAVAAWRRPEVRRLVLVALGFLLLAPTHAHYLWALAPLWALLTAVGAAALAGEGPRARQLIPAVAVTLGLAGPAWGLYRIARLGPPPTTPGAREAFLQREIPLYPALRWAEREDPGVRIYSFGGEHLQAYATGSLLGDTNGPASFRRLLGRTEELGSLAAALDELGVRCLIVSRRDPWVLDRARQDPLLAPGYEDAQAVGFRVLPAP